MKATIHSKSLNKLASRAYINNAKETLNRLFRIDILENNIQIIAVNNFDNFAVVGAFATVYESGTAYVCAKDFVEAAKKTADEVTITDSDTRLTLSCNGKSINIWKMTDGDISIPEAAEEIENLFRVPASDLLETVKKLNLFTASDDLREAFNGININAKTMRMTACDGNRLAFRKVPEVWVEEKSSADLVSNRFFVDDLVKVMNGYAKSEETILIRKFTAYSPTADYIRIDGHDFTFISRCLDGDYLSYERLLYDPNFCNVRFTLDKTDDLRAAATECAKMGSKRTPAVMLIGLNGYKLNACYLSDDSDDRIGYPLGIVRRDKDAENPEDWVYSFNANYIKDAAEVFKHRENVNVYFDWDAKKFPRILSCVSAFTMEDDEWLVYIMPIRQFVIRVTGDSDGNEVVDAESFNEAVSSRDTWMEFLRSMSF